MSSKQNLKQHVATLLPLLLQTLLSEPDSENAGNEATTVVYVYAKILKGCSCLKKCFQ